MPSLAKEGTQESVQGQDTVLPGGGLGSRAVSAVDVLAVSSPGQRSIVIQGIGSVSSYPKWELTPTSKDCYED